MTILTPEQGRELQGLYEQMPGIIQEALAAIAYKGMESPEFRDADGRLSAAFARVREIRGS